MMIGKTQEIVLVAALAIGVTAASTCVAESVLLAAAPSQPSAESLQPGLAPVYFYNSKFNSVHEVYRLPVDKGKVGPPLPVLNHRSGEGNVLSSDSNDLVGARIEGMIHFDLPGVYEFAFESNDGVRLDVAGKMVVEDPDVHSDQFSDVGTVEITEPGWYPLVIWYFEKRNTSTLRFLWRKPPPQKTGKMLVVPAQSLAHVPAR